MSRMYIVLHTTLILLPGACRSLHSYSSALYSLIRFRFWITISFYQQAERVSSNSALPRHPRTLKTPAIRMNIPVTKERHLEIGNLDARAFDLINEHSNFLLKSKEFLPQHLSKVILKSPLQTDSIRLPIDQTPKKWENDKCEYGSGQLCNWL